jgi:predicted protein tyrosine phosphatase
MEIFVCPLSRLSETLGRSRAQHVVTVVRSEELIRRERDGLLGHRLNPGNHLWIEVDDIAEELDGMIAPGEQHIEELIGFLEKFDRTGPIVVHCYAGISRSTAVAYILACLLSPQLSESEIARRLRQASPTARPNARFVALADARLKRDGRMVRAMSMIGEGSGAYEGEPFAIHLD